jgi:ParB-like chromosome segregation protein Spo0J
MMLMQEPEGEKAAAMGSGEYFDIPLARIIIDAQIRGAIDIEGESFRSLVASIRQWGVLVPITVIRQNDDYRLIAGERRLRACMHLEMPTIPARVLEMEDNRREVVRVQLIENLQREDLNPIDEANAYVNYFNACHDAIDPKEFGNIIVLYKVDPQRVSPELVSTVDTIVNISGKSVSSIWNRLTLLKLPEELRTNVKNGEITPSQGYILAEYLTLPNLVEIARQIVAAPVTNAELKKILTRSVNAAKGGMTKSSARKPFISLRTTLRQTRVNIETGSTACERADVETLLAEVRTLAAYLEERLQAEPTDSQALPRAVK